MAKKKALTKDQLFKGASKIGLDSIDIPELGGVIYLAPLTASEILPFISADDSDGILGMNARQNNLIVRAIVDEKSNRIFDDEDADKMNDLPWDVYRKIVQTITGKVRVEVDDAPLPDGENSPSS